MSNSCDHFIFVFHAIIDWFNQHKRDLPWRNLDDPYLVWISEIMLQQTQVDVVLPYFLNWKDKFPNLKSLAEASIEDVIQAFAGLGYYSRAKNISKAAKLCFEKYNGQMPNSLKELLSLPGVGKYTAGAILSFAYKEKGVAVDGNVLRVMSRILGSKEPIDQLKTKDFIEKFLEDNTPKEKFPIFMEGMIELGALVCKKKADCMNCPLRSGCAAYKNQEVGLIPIKAKQAKTIELKIDVFIYQKDRTFFIEKKKEGEWNAGLYEFPQEQKSLNLESSEPIFLKPFHSFITHHKLLIMPRLIKVNQLQLDKDENWVTLNEIKKLPLSSAHKKIVSKLLQMESQGLIY